MCTTTSYGRVLQKQNRISLHANKYIKDKQTNKSFAKKQIKLIYLLT